MHKILFLASALACSVAIAQPSPGTPLMKVTTAPIGICQRGDAPKIVTGVTNSGLVYSCQSINAAGQGVWTLVGNGASGVAGSVTAPHLTYANGPNTVGDVPNSSVDANGNIQVATIGAASFNPQSIAAGPWVSLFNDFFNTADIATANIGVPTSATCTSANTFQDVSHPGNIRLASGTASAGTGLVCYPISNSSQPTITSLNAAPGWTWGSAVYIGVLPGTTAGSYQAGMAGTIAASPWTTGIGFYLSSANGVVNDWYCEYGSTYTDSTIAATVAWARLTMVQDGAKMHWYINGTEVCGTGVAIANLPSNTMLPWAFTDTSTTATSLLFSVDYVLFQRQANR